MGRVHSKGRTPSSHFGLWSDRAQSNRDVDVSLSLNHCGWLDVWRQFVGPWPSFLYLGSSLKSTLNSTLKFRGNKRGQDYLASINCMAHFRLLSKLTLLCYYGYWIIKKAREFQKNIYFCFIDYANAFDWITINWGKFWKRWEYQTTWPASWETCMQVWKQQLELNMEQQTGSK